MPVVVMKIQEIPNTQSVREERSGNGSEEVVEDLVFHEGLVLRKLDFGVYIAF